MPATKVACAGAAVELGRIAQDWIHLGAALEGYAAAKVLAPFPPLGEAVPS
jgi:hypothetical protein